MANRTVETCGHCQRPQRGMAAVGDIPLCHPNQGLDCYRLVTVYRHPTPCTSCRQALDTWQAGLPIPRLP